MEEQIEELEKLKLKITANLKEWVKDKSIPLDERWKLFFKSGLGMHIGSIEEFVNFNSDDYCDNMQRHEIVHLEDVSDRVNSLKSDNNYNEFREDVLSKFIKSFEWDW